MNTKKLSLLAVLALSSGFLRADILDLEYTKSDLAAVEKTAAVAGTCKAVYELFMADLTSANAQKAFKVVDFVGDVTEQAIEGGNSVSTIKRLAGALKDAKATLTAPHMKNWVTKDYAKMVAALTFGVAKELAHGHVIKTVKKHFASPKQRLYRRGLYVGKDVMLEGMFNTLETLVENQLNDNSKELWTEAKNAMLTQLVKSLAVQIISEVLVSTTEDDDVMPEVAKVDKLMDKMSNPVL